LKKITINCLEHVFIPVELTLLTSLEEIEISTREYICFPKEVSNVPSWKSLKCDGWITTKNIPIDDFLLPEDCTIPDWFTQCTSLNNLELPINESMSLPNLSNLLHLKSLRFRDESMTIIPDWLANLPNLNSILAFIEDNTIEKNWKH
tara:strand:+ start:350 stop:793 length:444 start_codon:yes stop_codon:yes gene_type:complete